MFILLMKESIEKITEVSQMEYKEITYKSLSFTTEPKTRKKINFGYTIIGERCKNVMEHLWSLGIKELATYDVLENAVALCVGMDRRTIRRYIGFAVVNKKNGGRSWVKGYLERLGLIERFKNGNYFVNHFKVNRDYHYEITPLSATLTSPFVDESHKVKMTKDDLCVCLDKPSSERGFGEKAFHPTIETINNNNNNTHTLKVISKHIEDGER